ALVDSLATGPLVGDALARLRRELDADLADPRSALSGLVDRALRGGIVGVLDDGERRQAFDHWVRTMSQDLLRRHHHEIGRTERDYLEGLRPDELVDRIEARVGSDLQFIRLNGAVVGGLIGILLALLHTLLAG